MATTSEVIARIAGKTRRVASRLAGDVGIVATLKEERQAILSLLHQIPRSFDGPGDGKRAHALCARLRAEISAHANAEERTIYSTLIELDETDELAAKALAEHDVLAWKLEQLLRVDARSSHHSKLLDEIEQDLREHIDSEENRLLQFAAKAFSKTKLEQLESEFLREKRLQYQARKR